MNKAVISIIGAGLTAVTSYATLIPVSIDRSVSISGAAGSGSYNQTIASNTTDPFNQDITALAGTTVPFAESRARQASTISPDEILIDTLIRGETRTDLAHPTPVNASASSLFELTFSILNAQSYSLGSMFTSFGGSIFSPLNLSFQLSSPTETLLNAISNNGTFSLTGSLPPNTYTLRLNTNVAAETDPLGDLDSVSGRLAFQVTSVPDTGSTLVLLGLALVPIVLFHKTRKEAQTY